MKLVLFDCDGTLADSEAFLTRMAADSFHHFGVSQLFETYKYDFLRMSSPDFFEKIKCHLTSDQNRDLKHHFMSSLRAERDKGAVVEPLYAGIVDMLVALNASGYLLGVVTNKGGHGLNAVLNTNNIAHHFVTLHHCDNSPGKPAPDMVLNALAATGADKINCIVVGDTMMDVLVAKNAGVRVIGAQWGVQNTLDGADRLVNRVEDLPSVLAEMFV